MNLTYFGARFYDPEIALWTSTDPLEEDWNVYGYCGGDPINRFDPNGEYTEVMIWSPVGTHPIPFTDYFAGHSGFGHVSVDINGTTYSMAPGGMHIESTVDYVNKQVNFRGGVGRTLKLTPEQETKLADILKTDKSKYDFLKNNCVSPSQNALNKLGVDAGNNLLPADYGKALDQSGMVQDYNLYKNITPMRVENGFEGINTLMSAVNISIDAMLIASQVAQAAAAAAGTVTAGVPIITSVTSIILP